MFAQLRDEDGVIQSNIEIADALWAASASTIRYLVATRFQGYELVDIPDPRDLGGPPERTCVAMGDVTNWIATLPDC